MKLPPPVRNSSSYCRRSSNGWSRKCLQVGVVEKKGALSKYRVIWFKTYLTISLYKWRTQEMNLYCAGSTFLWSLMWEDRESSITCREPYYFWFTFVLENVKDQNTLVKHPNERALSESTVYVRHEYKCVLFIKSMFHQPVWGVNLIKWDVSLYSAQ